MIAPPSALAASMAERRVMLPFVSVPVVVLETCVSAVLLTLNGPAARTPAATSNNIKATVRNFAAELFLPGFIDVCVSIGVGAKTGHQLRAGKIPCNAMTNRSVRYGDKLLCGKLEPTVDNAFAFIVTLLPVFAV